MRSRTNLNIGVACSNAATTLGVSVLLLFGGAAAFAQAPMAPMAQPGASDAAGQNQQLSDQITELRGQVAKLQAAAARQAGPVKKMNSKPGMKMSQGSKGMGMMGEMGMPPQGPMASGSAGMAMKDDGGEMGGMAPAGNATMAPGMGMDEGEMGGMPMGGMKKGSAAPAAAMGMCCMGEMGSSGNAGMSGMPPASGGMAPMSGPSSAMPGQAGASHLYHIGSNGFFLNHPQHISLTPDQRMGLNRFKEKAMLDRAYEQRRIDQGEQELYTLTGADQPDNAKIQSKVGEIEKLRSTQRMNFIRTVEEASNVLTPDQRKVLVGTMAANKK